MTSLEDRIVLERGDLTDAGVDAIVNAANNDLQLGGGVAGAIRRKGGSGIQQECNRIGAIEIGGAAITTGGTLKAKYVIHAASMRLGGATAAESLRDLARAKEKGVRSVAFPAVGTGIAGFPMKECAAIMLEEVVSHLKGETSVEQVRFVLFDQAALKVFEQVWQSMKAKSLSGL
jgi:O-acetyl-ADP-ribose deacetylase (regulator of RNase III)